MANIGIVMAKQWHRIGMDQTSVVGMAKWCHTEWKRLTKQYRQVHTSESWTPTDGLAYSQGGDLA